MANSRNNGNNNNGNDELTKMLRAIPKPIGKALWKATDVMGIVVDPIMKRYRDTCAEWYRIQQLRTNGFTDEDVWGVGRKESLRMSKMLAAMEKRCMGSPRGYDDKSRWLIQRDGADLERWLDSEPGWALLERMDKPRFYKERLSVRELGIAYCAWREDLEYASNVLALADKWLPYGVDSRYREYCRVFGMKEAEKISNRIRAEAQRAWHWIADNIYDLWA